MNSSPTPVVFLRPIGSPLTIAMSGLAVGSLVHSGLDLHWIARSQAREVGLILLAVPFVLQLIGSVFSYLARDGAAGATMGLLAASWLAIGLVEVVSGHSSRSGSVGLMLLAVGGLLLLSAIAVAGAKPLPAAVFAASAVRFLLAGIYHVGGSSVWLSVAGVVGLVVAAAAAYCVLAFELEGQKQRPVLPTLRRGRGRAAVSGDAPVAIDGFVHEPGVRRTT